MGRDIIAWVAHYYGQDPRTVETWKTSEIYEWSQEASRIERQRWKTESKDG